MSAAAQTKLFGVRIPVDPKILFGCLAALIAVLFWYNSRGDEEPSTPATANVHTDVSIPAAAVPLRARVQASRRAVAMNDRSVLRLRPIDPTKGDIDPTLRLDLLARLQGVQPAAGGRSLFESGGDIATGGVTRVPVNPPILRPGPRPGILMPGAPGNSIAEMAAIPLKYYGYVRPTQGSSDSKPSNISANILGSNRGFFLDGDNVLVASEGDVLKQKYLVVELTPNSARLEDTQLRKGQTLPVVAAAMP